MKALTPLMFVAALALSACGPTAILTGGIPAQLPSVTEPIGKLTLADDKALLALEASALEANKWAETAVDAGLIKPGSPRAIQIADALVGVDRAVKTARNAYRLGNLSAAQAAAAAAQEAINQFAKLRTR